MRYYQKQLESPNRCSFGTKSGLNLFQLVQSLMPSLVFLGLTQINFFIMVKYFYIKKNLYASLPIVYLSDSSIFF